MLKVLTVIGARPQFIKAAVLSRLIKQEKYSSKIKEIIVHTGQHYDENMSDIFFKEMEIPKPDYHLGIGSLSHGAMTAAMLEKIEKLILKEKPEILLVYGDTNSTLAGALAASKLLVPVAHVEAGLRSFMMSMPEEQNRRLTDHLSTYLFCPTEVAVKNLEKEGIPYKDFSEINSKKNSEINLKNSSQNSSKNNSENNSENKLTNNLKNSLQNNSKEIIKPSADEKLICLCGDIMYEASLYYRKKAENNDSRILEKLPEKFILLTMHRQENTDDILRLSSIFSALNKIQEYEIVFPVHPRTKKVIEKNGIKLNKHIHCIEPVGYFDMLLLESKCYFIMTDSGGVQKEAYFFGKPCITLRDSTEWTELVESGWNTLVGADEEKIMATVKKMPKYGKDIKLYGEGNTSEIILDTLISFNPNSF
jgi:UDP-GlcNAc3NAcA epimerase